MGVCQLNHLGGIFLFFRDLITMFLPRLGEENKRKVHLYMIGMIVTQLASQLYYRLGKFGRFYIVAIANTYADNKLIPHGHHPVVLEVFLAGRYFIGK